MSKFARVSPKFSAMRIIARALRRANGKSAAERRVLPVPYGVPKYLVHGADIFTQRAVTFVTVDGTKKRVKKKKKVRGERRT